MHDTCELIISKDSIFEKALLTLILLSYIQAFSDGNKRTARITSNAILIANGYCPLSFRSVDSIDYKKAMLIFYEYYFRNFSNLTLSPDKMPLFANRGKLLGK